MRWPQTEERSRQPEWHRRRLLQILRSFVFSLFPTISGKTGFGEESDALGAVLRVPPPPRNDMFASFCNPICQNRYGCQDHVLRSTPGRPRADCLLGHHNKTTPPDGSGGVVCFETATRVVSVGGLETSGAAPVARDHQASRVVCFETATRVVSVGGLAMSGAAPVAGVDQTP